ncbi:MAG: hypothetical protein ACXWNC_04150 [Anaerolineales bacterium]
MSKYVKYRVKQDPKKVMNPIWRGIGCILLVVVPLLAFGLMELLVPVLIKTGKVPSQLVGYVRFPDWAYKVMIISSITRFIGSLQNLWISIITFFVIVLLLTTIASLLYTWMYSLVGPAQYSALDAPPSKHKAKAYKR